MSNEKKLDAVIEPILHAGRIPGAALAIVAGGRIIYVKEFGYRDLKKKKPVTPSTLYPIASTTKPMNATLIGMLVAEGRLDWDAPVRQYIPHFCLQDEWTSTRVTLRDLVTMRTGLPRHDSVWEGSSISRAELVKRLRYLDLSSDFRRRFQYCNLSVTAAGHVAEVVTGQTWESLIQRRLLSPLGMRESHCTRPASGNATLAYHENARRELLVSRLRASQVTAPSGGAICSTVTDMTRWILFNLRGGKIGNLQIMDPKALAQIHAPQVVIGDRPLAGLPPDAAYALGWLVDSYNGHKRLSHGGYLDDVNSSVMFFPALDMGMACFTNFGCPVLAATVNQYAFDALMSLQPVQTFQERIQQYDVKIEETRKRNASLARTPNTRSSHPVDAYVGRYEHPGYGVIEIGARGRQLLLRFHDLRLALEHWHYDSWVAEDDEAWPLHQAHAFDRGCRIQFQTNPQGNVSSLSVPLEPEVKPLCFTKVAT